jgi:large subunit ribosomal protein L9
MKQAERIRETATKERSRLNEELGAVAEQLNGMTLTFPVKAGETGKLYGSITPAMVIEAIEAEKGIALDKRQLDAQPIKTLGVHQVEVRLTIDLVPELTVVVHREGEAPETAYGLEEELVEEAEQAGQFIDLQAELEAEFDVALEEAEAEMGEVLQDVQALELPDAMPELEQEPSDEADES